MHEINEILKKYDIKPRKYEKNKKTTIIETDQNKYVLKQKKQNKEIFDYLATRNFDYIPKSLNDENDESGEVYPFYYEESDHSLHELETDKEWEIANEVFETFLQDEE